MVLDSVAVLWQGTSEESGQGRRTLTENRKGSGFEVRRFFGPLGFRGIF